MHFNEKMTIQSRLKLLLCLPLLFLAFILSKDSHDQYTALQQAGASRDIATLAALTSEIAHQLQEERSLTDAFLGGRGKRFRELLPAQRSESNKRINQLKDFLGNSRAGEHDIALASKMQTTIAALHGIDDLRRQVDSLAISGSDAFSQYSGAIGEIRTTIRLISQVIPNQELMRLVAAHYNFLEMTMRLHGERLLMTNTFTNNEFAILMFMRFAEGLAEQRVYIDNFLTLANPDTRNFYQAKTRDTALTQVEAMRQVAVDKRFGGGFNIDPEQWRSAATAAIGLMKAVESRLIADYLSAADQHHYSSMITLAVRFGFGFLVFWSSVLFAIFLSHRLVKSLTRISTDINEGAQQVSSAAHQLAATSQTVADSSSRQAASLEETSASTEEMSAMIKRDAENASQADSLMQEANKVLAAADSSMQKLTGSMTEINAASVETQKIVKTIDEIAFQTNLLALNAAVEAARAGEAGAGFAVVADEVRNLAMRAAEAAKNTSVLIEGTVQKVSAGAALVSETSKSFASGRSAVEKIAILLTELATASREEASAVHQVNEAIAHIDRGTQENAASAEEMAASAEELSAQARVIQQKIEELLAIVGKDGINSTGGKQGRKGSPAPAGKFAARHSSSLPGKSRASAAEKAAPSRRITAPGAVAPPAKAVPRASSFRKTGDKRNPAEVIPFNDDEFEDF
jgi:methyl-accepting chemotaxis protein